MRATGPTAPWGMAGTGHDGDGLGVTTGAGLGVTTGAGDGGVLPPAGTTGLGLVTLPPLAMAAGLSQM